MSNKRLIDGEKLLESINNTANEIINVGNCGYLVSGSFVILRDEIESGKFDIHNQGEAARLREALESIAEIIRNEGYGTSMAWTRISNILVSVLSPSTEDTGIQKVRICSILGVEVGETFYIFNRKYEVMRNGHILRDEESPLSLHDDIMDAIQNPTLVKKVITIPGITDGGESDA